MIYRKQFISNNSNPINKWTEIIPNVYYCNELIINRNKSSIYYISSNTSIKNVQIMKSWDINIIDYKKYYSVELEEVVIILFRKYRNIYHMVEGFNSLLTYYIERALFPPVGTS